VSFATEDRPLPATDTSAPTAGTGGRARVAAVLVSLLLLFAAFACDWLTGSEVASSLFYVIVIMFGAWFAGRRLGLALALLSVVAWGVAHRLTGVPFSRPRVLYWNLLAELAIYLITALAVAEARSGLDRVHALAARLEDARRALERETHAVGRLQLQLLPQRPPSLPGYSWEIVYLTSTRAGGDYYDFFPLADGRTVVLVADASGHGASAAVLMAMTRVLLHTAPGLPDHPDRLLARLNDQLVGALPSAWFVTACAAVIDPASGAIEYSLAGHPAPWLVHGGGRPECLASPGGPPLGAFEGSLYRSGATVLAPGETLVLHTDGLTEAMAPDRELFGEVRLRDALGASSNGDLAGLRRTLLERVDGHRAGAPLSDDLTLLLLRRGDPRHAQGAGLAAPRSKA
jgi:serine phosphatase RsbU (regulator of sigma subunit)